MRRELIKRALDLALGVPALVASAPVILGLATAVRLTSPGPAFFVQTRVGRGRRPIRVVKLRTMARDADRTGGAVTAAGDPRVTPLGRLLRATKLDELPQLLNVVRGDMSLVGPRPELERNVARYRPEWEAIFSVRPGITDPATLVFRDEEALLSAAADRDRAYLEVILPAKVRLALDGVARASVAYDLGVIVRTAAAVLRIGGRAPHPAVAEARRAIAALDPPARFTADSPHGKATP
jgi:lipopolysaccharide/colanic/teichoic acid biosynthesis glycosyltransferase